MTGSRRPGSAGLTHRARPSCWRWCCAGRPADWAREATRAHFSGRQTGRWYGYGYQTWVFPENHGSFALLGVRGQAIFVDPVSRLVLVNTAVRPTARDSGGADTVALWRALRRELGRTP